MNNPVYVYVCVCVCVCVYIYILPGVCVGLILCSECGTKLIFI